MPTATPSPDAAAFRNLSDIRSPHAGPDPNGYADAVLLTTRWVLLFALMMVIDLLPLVGLLPAVADSSNHTVTAYPLLPLIALPTIVAAARGPRAIYQAQVVLGGFVCVAAMVTGVLPVANRVVGALATVGSLVFVTILVRRSRHSLAAHTRRLRNASITDPLTGILNRRGAGRALPELRARALADGANLGIALFDLDHFKQINDTHGHDTGDRVLRNIAQLAREIVGDNGIVARTGGEEFLLITIGDAHEFASSLVGRLRLEPTQPAVTISVGMTSVDPTVLAEPDDLWHAVSVADQALYRAKTLGRDRIERSDDTASPRTPATTKPTRPDDQATEQAVSYATSPVPVNPLTTLERSRAYHVDPAMRLLYQLLICWTMVVGIAATLADLVSGASKIAQSVGVLVASVVVGAAMVWVLSRVRTVAGLIPIAAIGSATELIAVLTVAPTSRPAALMLAFLTSMIIAIHWPRWPLTIQLLVTAVGAFGAALMPSRPAMWVVCVALACGVPLLVALVIVGGQRRREETLEDELHQWSMTDPLTGLGNRRALAASSARWKHGFVVIVDVDTFKQINDKYGHTHGDRVLQGVARALEQAVADHRGGSRAYRLGGDEFVVVGPGSPTLTIVDDIHAGVAATPFDVTVTVGAASWTTGLDDNPDRALTRADHQLLRRKIRKHGAKPAIAARPDATSSPQLANGDA